MTPPIRALWVTNMYPTEADPAFGAFVASQRRSVEEAGVRVTLRFIDGRRAAWRYAAAIPAIGREARPERFDLVHAHYGLTGFVASFHRLPLVVSFCGDDLLGTPDGRGGLTPKSRLTRRLSGIAARRAAAIICKSEELRDALPRSEDRGRAQVIPNGVDTRLFRPGDRAAARARLGLRPEERLVLFPHTPHERRKRLDLAQAAVARLAELGTPARLWVVQGVPPEEMPFYYQAADCLLLTSDWEGSPNVVKEALCCDLPVVAVDCGDVRDWLTLANGGWVVVRTPEAIAANLHDILQEGRRVDGAGIRAALTLERVAQRILALYQEALRAKGTLG